MSILPLFGGTADRVGVPRNSCSSAWYLLLSGLAFEAVLAVVPRAIERLDMTK